MFIEENAFEIVVRKFAAILSRPQCDMSSAIIPQHWDGKHMGHTTLCS